MIEWYVLWTSSARGGGPYAIKLPEVSTTRVVEMSHHSLACLALQRNSRALVLVIRMTSATPLDSSMEWKPW